ncbi:hypothetical protein BDW68DRAFT_193965 [Aspergillus falconensis]
MAGPYRVFYLENHQTKDLQEAYDEQTHIRVPSIDSTVISINSPRIEASSVASSLTLVDESSATMGPPAYGKLSYTQDNYEELTPKPLRPRKSVQPSLPDLEPPSYTQLATKPLPPTPSLSRKSRVPRVSSSALDRSNGSSPVLPLSGRDMVRPEVARSNDVVATNQATAGPGYPSKPSDSSTVCFLCQDNIEVPSADGSHEFPIVCPQTTAFPAQLPSTATDAVPSTLFPHEEKDTSPGKGHYRVFTRALQRLWPPKLLGRRRAEIHHKSASLHCPPTPYVRPVPHPGRQPRLAGAAPSTSITRMKRVLSVLMDERMSLYLNNLVAAAGDDSLLRHTEVLIVDGFQSACPQVQEPTNIRLLADYSSLRHHARSLYELDGLPLTTGKATPTTHPGVSIFHRIMREVDDLPELFSLALVNKASYLAFKSDELGLMKSTLKKISPSAWELREIKEASCYTEKPGSQAFAANLYLRHYTWDLMRLANIKFLLQDHCEPLLSKDMVVGLRDPYDRRAERVNAAIWRVWTFCHLFGNRKDREDDFQGQSRWLRGQRTTGALELPQVCRTSPDPADFNTVLFSPPDGFAQGNPVTGLSRQQLLDMVDIWIAMGALLDFLRKQTRLARQHGVFDAAGTPPKAPREEVHMLRAWLDFILTLGPAAVFELAPAGPNSDPAQAFSRAKANGWTQWSPPPPKAPGSNFLVGIVRSMLRTMPDDNDFDGNAI